MSCPKCNSQKLWDDDMWWGCKSCDFVTNSIRHNARPGDVFNEGQSDEWWPARKRK